MQKLTIQQINTLTDRGKEYYKRAITNGLVSGDLEYNEELIEYPLLTKDQVEELAEALGIDIIEPVWERIKKELNI